MEAALNSSLGRTVLGPSVLKIGRAADNTLVIQDPQASSHHTEIAPGFGGTSYQVTDLGSTNGTFVNEQRLAPNSPHTLNPGDVIRIGSTTMTYETSEAAGYAPTMAASAPMPSYEPTIAVSDPFAQAAPPVFQQPQAYPNYPTPAPAQPAYPQPGYPQAQPMYPQQGYPQQGYPQPSYPQPGGFGQPSMPPPQKKSNPGLFIVIAVILVLIVGGGGAYFYIQAQPSPQKTLQTFCSALKAGDYQTVYNQYSSRVQNQLSEAQFAGFLKLGLDLSGGITACTVSNVVQDSSTTAHGSVTTTTGNGKTTTGTTPLVLEKGAWKIDTNTNGN
jgi:FHA domain-containing protein